MLSKFSSLSAVIQPGLVKKAGMVTGTFAVAMGIGFLMQQGDVSASRMTMQPQPAVEPAAQPVLAAAAPEKAPVTATPQEVFIAPQVAPEAAKIEALVEAQLTDSLVEPVALTVTDEVEIPRMYSEMSLPTDSCQPRLTATPIAAAMVDLELSAACNPNERLTIHHEGMMFTLKTDAQGAARVEAPALSESAVFIAAFSDGSGVVAQTEVNSLAFYDRVVLQWEGETGLQVHALEFGATYGEEGHVWAEAGRAMAVAANGEGGFLMRLGDAASASPRMAEVYTFPTGMTRRAGAIELSVEAQITPINCNLDISAQTLQVRRDEPVRIGDLTLAIPACETIGELLVLKNVFEDLTLSPG